MKRVQQLKKVTEWIAHMAMLNLIWLLFSLPIVTIIPALDALFDVLAEQKTEVQEFHVLFRLFLAAFKKNFKQSYRFAIPILGIVFLLFIDVAVLNSTTVTTTWFLIYKYVIYLVSILSLISVLLGYSLSKRTKDYSFKVFYKALTLGIKHPIVLLALVSSLFFLNILMLRWPTLSYFFSMSVTCWLATQAVGLIDRKMIVVNEMRKV